MESILLSENLTWFLSLVCDDGVEQRVSTKEKPHCQFGSAASYGWLINEGIHLR